jgi:hypothetical protein
VGAVTARTAAAVLAVALLSLTGCAGGPQAGCPAVAYLPTLVVRLAGDWPTAQQGSLSVTCSTPCTRFQMSGNGQTGHLTGALTGMTTRLQMETMPGSLTITVRGPQGPVTEVRADLTWRRVGGSEECGGPMEAEVTILAP